MILAPVTLGWNDEANATMLVVVPDDEVTHPDSRGVEVRKAAPQIIELGQ